MAYRKERLISILMSTTAKWFLLLSPIYACGYLDPGSGSMVLQVLLGGAAALIVILKLYWRRLLSVFGLNKKKKVEN